MTQLSDPLGIVGTLVDGKYRVEAAIASGGAAVVYRAYHVVWNLDVALKVLVSVTDAAPDEKQRLLDAFVQEARIIAALSTRSPVIVIPRDTGKITTPDGGTVPYLVLEWLDGDPLDVVLTEESAKGVTPRTMDETFDLLEPVAMALDVAHKEGVVHRDVKPENIFILGDPRSSERRLKLIDFGISKVMASLGSLDQTGYAVTPFTPQYGAPEQFSRSYGPTGPWTDVFALALVIIETMRGGRRAFSGDDYVDLARQSRNEQQRPTPRAFGLDVGPEVELVMARAVSTQPQARYPSAGDLWLALESALQRKGGPRLTHRIVSAPPQPSISSAPAPPAPTGRGRAALWGAAFAALLAFGCVVFVGWRLLGLPRSTAGAPATAAPSKRITDTPASASPIDVARPPASSSAAAPSVVPAASASLCPEGAAPVVGGRYARGDASDPDAPRRTVFVDTFCLDETEVTVARYAACVKGGHCAAPPEAASPRCNFGSRDTHPMNCVTFAEASDLCAAEGKRLPTEAEWELAARGPHGFRFPWGNQSRPTWANLCNGSCASSTEPASGPPTDGFDATSPVDAFDKDVTASAIRGLGGNVSEWCADYFAPYGPDGSTEVNPKGPPTGDKHVVRGASFATKEDAAGAYRRRAYAPGERSPFVGFRCAAAIKDRRAP